jgi:hypothetical protein
MESLVKKQKAPLEKNSFSRSFKERLLPIKNCKALKVGYHGALQDAKIYKGDCGLKPRQIERPFFLRHGVP